MSTRPIALPDGRRRWNEEDRVLWLEIETDQGWKKVNYMGDPISDGSTAAELAARRAPLEQRIADDWGLSVTLEEQPIKAPDRRQGGEL